MSRVTDLRRVAEKELAPMRGGGLLLAREGREASGASSLAADMDNPNRQVWVGTIDGTIVGYGIGHIEELGMLNDVPSGRLGVIDDLFVEAGARAVGVGEAMMDAMLAWFSEKGCHGVDALALPGNRSTKNFFEGSGFTARLLVMHRRLDA